MQFKCQKSSISNNSVQYKNIFFLFIHLLNVKIFLFGTIQFNISTSLNVKTVLFQTLQFNINQFSSIWPTDRILSGATSPDQSWPGSNDNWRVLRFPQSSSIPGASPDCFVSLSGHSLGESYSAAEMQSVCSAALVDWATNKWHTHKPESFFKKECIILCGILWFKLITESQP